MSHCHFPVVSFTKLVTPLPPSLLLLLVPSPLQPLPHFLLHTTSKSVRVVQQSAVHGLKKNNLIPAWPQTVRAQTAMASVFWPCRLLTNIGGQGLILIRCGQFSPLINDADLGRGGGGVEFAVTGFLQVLLWSSLPPVRYIRPFTYTFKYFESLINMTTEG